MPEPTQPLPQPPAPPVVEEEDYKLPEKTNPPPKPTPKPTNKRCNLAALNSDFNQYGVYGYNL